MPARTLGMHAIAHRPTLHVCALGASSSCSVKALPLAKLPAPLEGNGLKYLFDVCRNGLK